MDLSQGALLQHLIHYSFHFLLPGVLAYFFFQERWKKVWLILLATMLVDLDHIFATPIYDPNRCGIGFHILHSEYAIIFYVILLLIPKTRIVGLGLLLHMLTDSLDCLMSKYITQGF